MGEVMRSEDVVDADDPQDGNDSLCKVPDVSLYPSTLFHFTNRAGLLGILESNFKVRYCREHIIGKSEERRFGAPMVSFCDLRLSEVAAHMRKYGRYGIGLSKTWANERGLNTVYYISSRAELTDEFIVSVTDLYKEYQTTDDGDLAQSRLVTYSKLMNVYRYLKNYEGPLCLNERLVPENYRFADEREWRFVPNGKDGSWSFLSMKQMDDAEYRAKCEAEFPCLYFEPNDIRYIIVEREDERDGIIEHIQAVKDKYGPQDVIRLTSRILSSEQIRDDI